MAAAATEASSGEIKVVGICGSLRMGSTNATLMRFAAEACQAMGMVFEELNIRGFPIFNDDYLDPTKHALLPEEEQATAAMTLARVQEMQQKVVEADAVVFTCPEYNYGVSSTLKTAIDYLSRAKRPDGPMSPSGVFEGKIGAILGAGGGMGSSRAQYHLRQSFVFLKIQGVQSEGCFNAYMAFDNNTGELFTPPPPTPDTTDTTEMTDEEKKEQDKEKAKKKAIADQRENLAVAVKPRVKSVMAALKQAVLVKKLGTAALQLQPPAESEAAK